eukprot:gb/GFBE01045449.1/.p1 GENE.gb/GFBE01045449.1/~~gb/GFBE01045449.1/.p1  ORF type:complete len:147 (+),score=23.10 gb/GFBE01045449.1/:1-441(+)
MQLTGVMHPNAEGLKSCASVEDFLRAYEYESTKRGQPLIRCPDVPARQETPQMARSWTEEVNEGSSSGFLRTATEELNQVLGCCESVRGARWRSYQEQADMQSADMGLTDQRVESQVSEALQRCPQLVAMSLCTFSLGLALGLRGW